MSIVDDRLTDQHLRTPLSGFGIGVWGDLSLGKIWIAEQSDNLHVDSTQRLVCVEVALGEPESATAQRGTQDQQLASTVCSRLFLNISKMLLEKAAIFGIADLLSGRLIIDPVAFEMVLGIVEAYSLPHINEYTRCCMVTMLCAQLSETASAFVTPPRCRNTGFAHWQRTRLEIALSELGKCEISLELFATRCGLSVCHFARLFKVTYGMPFHQYIVQRKISRACALLSETQESISQIALECGFSDQSSFTRRFSAKTGTSPAAWRKGLLSAAR